MTGAGDAIVQALRARGFRTTYETTAIRLLSHPDLPGLEVRVGTTTIVFERAGQEVYRAPLDRVDLAAALARAGWRAGARGQPAAR